MKKMNAAQQLYLKLGALHVWMAEGPRRSANFCKAGPGRRHKQGKAK